MIIMRNLFHWFFFALIFELCFLGSAWSILTFPVIGGWNILPNDYSKRFRLTMYGIKYAAWCPDVRISCHSATTWLPLVLFYCLTG